MMTSMRGRARLGSGLIGRGGAELSESEEMIESESELESSVDSPSDDLVLEEFELVLSVESPEVMDSSSPPDSL